MARGGARSPEKPAQVEDGEDRNGHVDGVLVDGAGVNSGGIELVPDENCAEPEESVQIKPREYPSMSDKHAWGPGWMIGKGCSVEAWCPLCTCQRTPPHIALDREGGHR